MTDKISMSPEDREFDGILYTSVRGNSVISDCFLSVQWQANI